MSKFHHIYFPFFSLKANIPFLQAPLPPPNWRRYYIMILYLYTLLLISKSCLTELLNNLIIFCGRQGVSFINIPCSLFCWSQISGYSGLKNSRFLFKNKCWFSEFERQIYRERSTLCLPQQGRVPRTWDNLCHFPRP